MTQVKPTMLGHNNGPDIGEIIAEQMSERYQGEINLLESLLQRSEEMPSEIKDDETAGKVSDYLKRLASQNKSLDAIRKSEKEEWSAKANAVHAFFKKKMDKIVEVKSRVEEPLNKYLQAKEDEKRRIAAEKAEEERRKAEEARIEAERIAAEARRKLEEAEAEQRRIDEENEKKKAEAEAEAKRIQEEADKKAEEIRKKAEADALAASELAAGEAKKILKEAEKQAVEIVKEARQEAKEIVSDVKSEIKAAEETKKELVAEVRETTKEANRALDVAARADKFASKAEKATLGGSADFSRTRGDGSLASISEKWVGEVANRDELDLEALREHIPFDALNRAVQSWVNANATNRSLRGAHIYQDTKTIIR